jgi:hypothetical protein
VIDPSICWFDRCGIGGMEGWSESLGRVGPLLVMMGSYSLSEGEQWQFSSRMVMKECVPGMKATCMVAASADT